MQKTVLIPDSASFEESARANFQRNNKFFLFGEIDSVFGFSFLADLENVIELRSKERTPEPIKIYIESPGGRIDSAFATISQFEIAKAKGVPIHTFVSHWACSAASMIACAGHRRFVANSAYHLLHFARMYDYGHNPEMMERNLENGKFTQEQIILHYQRYSKFNGDLKEKLLADNFMVNGGQALIDAGLADELI